MDQAELKQSISLLLLAAGSSSRMGQSKQLLLIENEPLLLRSTKAALASSFENVVVVLGARENEHRSVIAHLPIQIVVNQHWEDGMGSSLKKGLSHLLNDLPTTQAVLIMVCDQPLLTSSHLDKIIGVYKQRKKCIVASRYADSVGVPALFDQTVFSELLNMGDNHGAKKLINQHPERLALVDFQGGEIDLDTWEEYQDFKNKRIP
ncbi:MAG TPA: nucleotidyltransferase family protein [Cyclobacteriaceae bacterium]